MFVMQNIINSVVRIGNQEKLNILTLCNHHEKYISTLCETGHNFYIPISDSSSAWVKETCSVPKNLRLLGPRDFTPLSFDFIICHDRLEQYNEAHRLAHLMHLPLILVDHCGASTVKNRPFGINFSVDTPENLVKTPTATVSLSSSISKSWPKNGLDLVIPLGVDTERFSPRSCGSESGPGIFNETLSPTRIVFDNAVTPEAASAIFGGLSKTEYSVLPTDSDVVQKEEIYREGDYFINSYTSITVKLAEAMACETVPICFRTPESQDFIEHGTDGFIIDTSLELLPLLKALDEDEDMRREVGKNAREKIVQNHSLGAFTSKWTHIFNYMKSQFHSLQ